MIPGDEREMMLACEGFLRRAAQFRLPFMLKGSYITRQYMNDPTLRIPADLDWVYLEKLSSEEEARTCFNDWAITVTEAPVDDNIVFRSFRENAFWRQIDYAMADDFPTVNTDLFCTTPSFPQGIDLSFDISFNLDVEVAPVPLLYQPLEGEPFVIPFTAPLALQISWKLHQCLVGLRFKDVFDLMHLLLHPSFDDLARRQCLQALVNECSADNVPLDRLECLLKGYWEDLHPSGVLAERWSVYRYLSRAAMSLADPSLLPKTQKEFKAQFVATCEQTGFGSNIIRQLPAPTRHSRRSFESGQKPSDDWGQMATGPDENIPPVYPRIDTPSKAAISPKKSWLRRLFGK